MVKIDLCCGNHPQKDFEGLDIIPCAQVKYVVDLNKERLPFKDNSVDEFYEQNSFYELENPLAVIRECYRCLKPNGILEFKEAHFSSQYSYLPMTRNFWGFSTARIFGKGYRENYGWEIIEIDFETGFEHSHPTISKIYKSLININRNLYEKHFSRIFPIFRVSFKLKKKGLI